MDEHNQCIECSELQAALADTIHLSCMNESEALPNHTLIYICPKNGATFQASPINKSGDLTLALKEIGKTQTALQETVSNTMSNLIFQLKDIFSRDKKNSRSQESLSAFKAGVNRNIPVRSNSNIPQLSSSGRSLESLSAPKAGVNRHITVRSNSNLSQVSSPGRSLDSLTSSPKYGISASLSKLKSKLGQQSGVASRPSSPTLMKNRYPTQFIPNSPS